MNAGSPLAEAAGSPRQTAVAAAASTAPPASAAAAAAASAASAASAAAASASRKLYARLGCSRVFLVEDIERPQTDVGDFFLAESDFMTRYGLLRRHIRSRPTGCC